jgi:hypothetical protein
MAICFISKAVSYWRSWQTFCKTAKKLDVLGIRHSSV